MTQENVTINIDLDVLAKKLLDDPNFIKAVANAIRIAQTKQARTMGNLYGPNAQRPKPAPTTKRRLS
jgi:hypothetical protein